MNCFIKNDFNCLHKEKCFIIQNDMMMILYYSKV